MFLIKRLIVTISIFLCMIILSILGLVNLYHVKIEIIDYIDKSKFYMENDDYESAAELWDEMNSYWEKKHDILVLYIRHYDIDEMSAVLDSSSAYINYEKKAEYISNLDKLKSIIEHLWKTEFPSITSIMQIRHTIANHAV